MKIETRGRPLAAQQIDLWHVAIDKAADAVAEEEYLALLSPDERERYGRLGRESVRREFLVGRALLRTTLARYLRIAPHDVEFQYNGFGKPSLSAPREPWEFNLSHSAGLAVCAIAAVEVGVDVEDRSRTVEFLDLARSFFAPAETAFLESLTSERQRGAFFEIWTLKEAFIKARGQGLSLPLADFAFTLQPPKPPSIAFLPQLSGVADEWQFVQISLPPDYQLAVAAHLPTRRPIELTLREVLPLRSPSVLTHPRARR